jgi:hypothetical protein
MCKTSRRALIQLSSALSPYFLVPEHQRYTECVKNVVQTIDDKSDLSDQNKVPNQNKPK